MMMTILFRWSWSSPTSWQSIISRIRDSYRGPWPGPDTRSQRVVFHLKVWRSNFNLRSPSDKAITLRRKKKEQCPIEFIVHCPERSRQVPIQLHLRHGDISQVMIILATSEVNDAHCSAIEECEWMNEWQLPVMSYNSSIYGISLFIELLLLSFLFSEYYWEVEYI